MRKAKEKGPSESQIASKQRLILIQAKPPQRNKILIKEWIGTVPAYW
ncbi:hypothetical protein OA011_00580 [bacterium]|nr:hypothetical protein [bacterium]